MKRADAREIDRLARAKNGNAGGCGLAVALILASWLGLFLLLGAALQRWRA